MSRTLTDPCSEEAVRLTAASLLDLEDNAMTTEVQTGMERIQRDLQIIDQLAPQRGGALNDFMINFGLNMVGNPPSGGIFQTAAKPSTRTFRTISTNKS